MRFIKDYFYEEFANNNFKMFMLWRLLIYPYFHAFLSINHYDKLTNALTLK